MIKFFPHMRIIYVYDALCGWCYGFSPVIKQFYEKYKDKVEFEVVSGGMVLGDRIGPIGEVAGYIRWAYKEVENRTGVTFGEAFLHDTMAKGTAIFTSIPPAIAMCVFRERYPNYVIPFAGSLQKGIYFDGIDPEDLTAYGEIAELYGWDRHEFVNKMEEEKFLQEALKDFQQTGELMVQGFPSVLLEQNHKFMPLVRGYVPLHQLETVFQEKVSSQS